MPIFQLMEKQFGDLKAIYSNNSELANHPEFFEERVSHPNQVFDTKEFIDNRIALCKAE